MTQSQIDQVDKQVAALEKKYASVLANKKKALDPTAILAKVCAVITVATPILKFAMSLFFFPKKWKPAIQRILDITTMVCGAGE